MKVSDIYANQEFFELEKTFVFEKYWIYFCQLSFLKKISDTFSRDICGIPVSVRNTGKELIAFENICSHRRATVFFEEYSNRPFVCKYHGWMYDDQAKLNKIPNSQIYEFTQQKVEECAKLKRYSLKVIGNMIFVNLSQNPISIEKQFHTDFLNQISESSNHFDDDVISTKWQAYYNWKLNFENVMDWNHVRFVHPTSFAPLQAKNNTDKDSSQEWKNEKNRQNQEKISLGEIDIRDLSYATFSDVNLPDRWFRKHIERYKDKDKYYSWYIFPNVNYCSIGGDHFLIQQFDPIDAFTNNYRLEITTAKRKGRVNFSPLLKALIEDEKKVINEDVIFLESQQNNLKKSEKTDYIQGINEAPLIRFRKWLIDNVYKK